MFGCIVDQGKIAIDIKRKTKSSSPSSFSNASVSNVQIINNQLVITGTGLDSVSNVKVNENSLTQNFAIETKSATQIIANSISAFSFDVSKAFNLILSDASASATFPIDFSLCNATLNGHGFNCSITAQDKDVLSYDQVSGKWKPRSINGLSYQGAWDANDPEPSGASSGDYYIVSIANAPYAVGDWIVWNGSAYDRINNSNTITSVFGRTGAVVATEGDYNLDKLLDVDLTIAPTNGKVLKYNGSKWVAADDLSGGGAGSVTSAEIANNAVTDAKIDTVSASKITGTIISSQIADGTIVNADISATAGIDYSKLNIPNASIPYAKLNIADGDIPAAKISGLPSATAILSTTITNGDTTHAPDGNAVYDALATKLNTTGGTLTVGTISGVPTPTNSDDVANKGYVDTHDALKVAKAGDTMTGALTLDSDLRIKGGSNYVTLRGHAASGTYNFVLPSSAGTSGYVLSTDGSGNTSWIDVTSAVTSLDTDDVAEGSRLYFTEPRVRSTVLTGLNTGTSGTIAGTDSVLSAFGKLQYQVTDLKSYGQWTKNVNDISYSAGNVEIETKLRLKDGATNYVELKAPATVTSTYTLTFPATTGGANQVLQTNGSGTLSWVDPIAGVQSFAKSTLPTCGAGEVLKSNGTTLSCVTDSTGAGAFSGAASRAVVTDAGGALSASTTTATEIGYVNGVTSSIQAQLDAKQTTIAAGTTAQYYRGDKSWQTLDTSIVPENTNLYFTTARAKSAAVADALNNGTTDVAPSQNAVYDALATKLSLTGGTLSVGTISGVPDPTNDDDVANKNYVDDVIAASGSKWTLSSGNVHRTTGNVGIGTTSPQNKLHIELGTLGASNPALAVSGVSNVGGDPFDVKAVVGLGSGSIGGDPVVGGGLEFNITGDYGGDPLDKIYRFVGATSLENITFSKGRIGIGAEAPIEKLDVEGNVRVTGKMRLKDNGVNYVEFKAPTTVTSTYTLTFPATAGSANQVLQTNGSGTLAWATITDASVQAFAKAALPTCGAGEVLKSNGTSFSCVTDSSGAPAFTGTAGRAIASDGSGALTVSATTATELGHLSGVTSAIQTQLDGKQPLITAGTTAQYYRGDKSWQTLDTSVVPENTNLYFTTARARTASVVDAIVDAVVDIAPSQNAVYDALATKLNLTGGTLSVGTINGVPTPTNSDDVSNKGYVDNSIATASGQGAMIPGSTSILMESCPGGWTDTGSVATTGSGMATCNGTNCRMCQSPASSSTLPASSVVLVESCPATWTSLGVGTTQGAA